MHTLERERDEDEIPTAREVPSGKWIVAVDRAQQLIRTAIDRLEAHAHIADVAAAIEDLRAAAALTRGTP
ncbi:MAG TPA: hypothetical protein VE987_05665 [Polyangiaceae bacterium]|nr:hypothetical protein [Polyangiaceae bacterium]